MGDTQDPKPGTRMAQRALGGRKAGAGGVGRAGQEAERTGGVARAMLSQGTRRLGPCTRVSVLQDEGQGPGFEARVVVLVESMIPRSTWRGPERLAHGSPFRGMSLLHLAAAQGYARLIETLSQWR